MVETRRTVGELLQGLERGDSHAAGDLFAALYQELHQRAVQLTHKQPKQVTLQATALVNEAYVRLAAQPRETIPDRDRFLAYAATAMRNVLVDHARRRRMNSGAEFPLDAVAAAFEESAYDLERLQLAHKELETFDAVMARAVDLRFFAGVSEEEVARMLEIPLRSFQRKWTSTKAWLRKRCRES
jgi:RNA polymerase sigma factor (TIGR02999 family)